MNPLVMDIPYIDIEHLPRIIAGSQAWNMDTNRGEHDNLLHPLLARLAAARSHYATEGQSVKAGFVASLIDQDS